jgi:hypothetical protein
MARDSERALALPVDACFAASSNGKDPVARRSAAKSTSARGRTRTGWGRRRARRSSSSSCVAGPPAARARTPGPLSWLHPAEPARDPTQQLVQARLPTGRGYAVACGHRLIFGCPSQHRIINGGRLGGSSGPGGTRPPSGRGGLRSPVASPPSPAPRSAWSPPTPTASTCSSPTAAGPPGPPGVRRRAVRLRTHPDAVPPGLRNSSGPACHRPGSTSDQEAASRAAIRSKNDAQPLPARRYWAGDRCPVWENRISVRPSPRSVRTTVTSS